MNNPIHVLQVTKSTGGVGEYIRWLVHGLDKERFQITVVCLSEGSDQLAAELSQLPHVRAISVGMNRYKIAPSDALVLAQLVRLLRREHFDVVHAHTSKPGFLARVAAAGTGIPVIFRPACFAFHPAASRFRQFYSSLLERFAAKYLTARIVAVCEDERALAHQFNVGRDEQIVTIYTGVQMHPFDVPFDRAALRAELGVPADAPLVGSVGRLNAQKAPLDFVRAAAQITARRPDVHFVWVGNGELEEEARALVESYGMQHVFHFAGQRRDVPVLLQTFDCFVLSSHWEGFSLVVLEAMAARLPIVATRVSGTSEAVLDGVTGMLVPPSNPTALAFATLAVVSDLQRAHRMGQLARQRVERLFTRQQMIANTERLYEQLARESGRWVPTKPVPLNR